MPRGADLAGQRHAAGCRVRARVASAGPSAHASLTHMEHVRALIGLVDADVPEDLLAQKIAVYINVGATHAPSALLDLLKARCPTNLGQFEVGE